MSRVRLVPSREVLDETLFALMVAVEDLQGHADKNPSPNIKERLRTCRMAVDWVSVLIVEAVAEERSKPETEEFTI